MAKTLYVCPCCAALHQIEHPGPAPARIEAPCLRCGCPVVLTPADRQPADANRPRFFFEATCPGCGERIAAESDTAEPPKVKCPHGCAATVRDCDRCGKTFTTWGRHAVGWLPACPDCGSPAVLPEGPEYAAIPAQHRRFLFARWLAQTGRISG
jgi:hypothetical protein